MFRKVLMVSIPLVVGCVVTAGVTVGATQTPTQPPQTAPAQSAGQSSAQAAAPAPPVNLVPNKDPKALSGIWKVNRELTSDTTKLQQQADNTPQTGPTPSSGHHFGFGRGGNTRPAPMSTESALQRRALLREMAETPQQVTVVIEAETTTFTDEQGVVRKFTTNGKDETLDLGAAQVKAVSKWEDGVLTVELTGGTLTLTETYQLTVQGHDLVVALSDNDSDKTKNVGAAAVPIKRIYERPSTGGH